MSNFNLCYQQYLSEFERYLEKYTKNLQTVPSVLGESMSYALSSGGKRIRPVLLLAFAELLHVPKEEALPFALALELIHTYSLVHDDLPSMDNDDFRRGKPSVHKQFGEANAILAGDGLLNEAYSLCFEEAMKGEKYALASKFLSECAGVYGMIAGQVADILHSESEKELSEEELFYIYEHKTGKLLLAPILIASILANNQYYLPLESFGKALGKLFQMTDDILDAIGEFKELGKTVGKDEKQQKLTCVAVYGLEGAKVRADMCAKDCHVLLEGLDGNTEFLHDLIDYIRNRNH